MANGNYLVLSYLWVRGTGAVTWGNGAFGTDGVVSSANSLISTYPNAEGGGYSVTTLSNGNYLVDVPSWEDNAGAVTFGDGMTGVSGTISACEQFGRQRRRRRDQQRIPGRCGYTQWQLRRCQRAYSRDGGRQPLALKETAITWCDGTTGTVGTVHT